MLSKEIANVIVGIPHIYFMALLFLQFGELKYKESTSFLITVTCHTFIWFVNNTLWINFRYSMILNLMTSIVSMLITTLIIYKGSLWTKLKNMMLIHLTGMSCELITGIICTQLGLFSLKFEGLPATLIILRNVFTSVIYVVYIFLEVIANRKKTGSVIRLSLASSAIAVIQAVMVIGLMKFLADELLTHMVSFTAVYSVIIMVGHQVFMAYLRKSLEYQQNQYELEQRAKKKEYQFQYYLMAKAQGEEIRNLCHDIRNQLQTVQFLLQMDGEKERERAKEMLSVLEEKIRQDEKDDEPGES